MLQWVALGLLVPVALVMLALWQQHLRGASRSQRADRLLVTTWCPLLASAGLLGLLWDRTGTVGEVGAFAVGSGAMVFAIITGVVLLVCTLGGHRDPWDNTERIPVAWPFAGVFLVLAGTAGRVSNTVGLIVLAMGIITLWLNTMPSKTEDGVEDPSQGQAGPLGPFMAALGMAACVGLAPEAWVVSASLVSWFTALAVLVILVRHRGAAMAVRASGWFAVLLPAFGLGLLAQDRLVDLMQGGRIPGVPNLDPTLRGTVGLLLPGLVLLATIFVLAGFDRWSSTWRSPSAMALVLAGILGLGLLLADLLA